SPYTSPFSLTPFIHPYVCVAPNESFTTFGKITSFKDFNEIQADNWLLVHPNMKNEKIFHSENVSFLQSDEIRLVPTASGRTLELVNSVNRGYFKLHYDGIIGRIPRDLSFKKAVSGPEISDLLASLIDENKLDRRFMLMLETGARIFRGKNDDKTIEWGMVWR